LKRRVWGGEVLIQENVSRGGRGGKKRGGGKDLRCRVCTPNFLSKRKSRVRETIGKNVLWVIQELITFCPKVRRSILGPKTKGGIEGEEQGRRDDDLGKVAYCLLNCWEARSGGGHRGFKAGHQLKAVLAH